MKLNEGRGMSVNQPTGEGSEGTAHSWDLVECHGGTAQFAVKSEWTLRQRHKTMRYVFTLLENCTVDVPVA